MERVVATVVLCVSLAIAGCGGGSDSSSDTTASTEVAASTATPGPEVILPGGTPPKKVVVEDLREGHGAEAKLGHVVTIQYVGKHWNGTPYSNSWTYRYAPSFKLGERTLPPGLVQGIEGMKVGGRRQVIVPVNLIHYPGEEHFRLIPRLDTLVFVVDLIAVDHKGDNGLIRP